MLLARDAIVGGVSVYRRLTSGGGVVWFLGGIAAIAALGCGNADPGDPGAAVARTLTKTEARAEIAAMCPGPFGNHEQCASCAEQATSVLEEHGWIPARHVELASFVGNDCVEADVDADQDADQDVGACAAHASVGPDFQRCVCNDGATIDLCASVACASSQAQDVICVDACRCNGGLFGTACVAGAAACAK
jgi:hypothetical protein